MVEEFAFLMSGESLQDLGCMRREMRAGTDSISCNSKVRASDANGGQRTVRREKRGMRQTEIKL